MEIVKHTYESHKLFEWLVADYANHWYGNKVGANPTEYQHQETKKRLKNDYIELFDYKLIKDPTSSFIKFINDKIDNPTLKAQIFELYRLSIQGIFLHDNNFSTALNLMSQEKMNKFISYLYEKAIDYDVPLRKEIRDLFAETQERSFIYIGLLKKKCAICGEYGEIHHYDNVNSIGGYKFDDGLKTRFMCLCRKHHTEIHNIGTKDFEEKYHLKGIYLKPNEVEILKMIYPNQFKAYVKEKNNE